MNRIMKCHAHIIVKIWSHVSADADTCKKQRKKKRKIIIVEFQLSESPDNLQHQSLPLTCS